MHVAMALHALLSSVELGSADAFPWIRCMGTAKAYNAQHNACRDTSRTFVVTIKDPLGFPCIGLF